MNKIQQLQAEITDHNVAILAIEKKYPDGDFAGESAEADYTALQEHVKGVEQKSVDLSELITRQRTLRGAAEGARQFDLGGATSQLPATGPASDEPNRQREFKTFGQLFMESPQYQAALKSGELDSSMPAEIKGIMLEASLLEQMERKTAGTLIYTGRTGFGADNDQPFPSMRRQAGYLPLLYDARTFSTLFRRTPITEEIIEYVCEKTFNNNAEMIAEATAVSGTSGTKPQSDFDFEVKTSSVKDLAHWMAITNKQLRQSNLRSLIDERLGLGLDLKVESQLWAGAGTGNELLGLEAAGIQLRAKGSDNIFDAIHKAMTMVRVTGLGQVDFVLMNPVDWETVRLTRENAATGTLGNYLFGPPSQAGVPQLWGVPVTLSTQIAAGKALVGDSRQAEIMDRERTGVRTGVINDMFIRNLQVLLMEMALSFIVWRPASFCEITGI